MRLRFTGLVGLVAVLPLLAAEEPRGPGPEPAVTLVAGPGQAAGTPLRKGAGCTGGGNIEVSQPSPDTLLIAMTGAAVARCQPCRATVSQFVFDLTQEFAIDVHDPRVKSLKLVMWGRTVGLLSSQRTCCNCRGAAEISTPGQAVVSCGGAELLALQMPLRTVAGDQNLSLHDRAGPVWTSIVPGKYTLHQVFGITARHGRGLFGKPAAADFAPEPALDPDWVGKKEPFHGVSKKDFGFQIILKAVADDGGGAEMR